jgi:hypothetical protein
MNARVAQGARRERPPSPDSAPPGRRLCEGLRLRGVISSADRSVIHQFTLFSDLRATAGTTVAAGDRAMLQLPRRPVSVRDGSPGMLHAHLHVTGDGDIGMSARYDRYCQDRRTSGARPDVNVGGGASHAAQQAPAPIPRSPSTIRRRLWLTPGRPAGQASGSPVLEARVPASREGEPPDL